MNWLCVEFVYSIAKMSTIDVYGMIHAETSTRLRRRCKFIYNLPMRVVKRIVSAIMDEVYRVRPSMRGWRYIVIDSLKINVPLLRSPGNYQPLASASARAKYRVNVDTPCKEEWYHVEVRGSDDRVFTTTCKVFDGIVRTERPRRTRSVQS